jgi:hypothetical protein
MDALFYLAPAVIAAGALAMAAAIVRRAVRLRRAWRSGLTAEGRCLAAHAEANGHGDGPAHTTRRHVYEFTTRDGRTVRFQERHGPVTTVAGDVIVVHYAPERPEHATAQPPRPGLAIAMTGASLVFLIAVVLLCVAFVTVYATGSAPPGDFLPSGG